MQQIEKLKELVDQFRYNLKDYTSWNFNETNTRQQFIDKFFELLGRDVNNHFWRSEQYKEVVLEDKLKIWWQAKAPDYSFRLWWRRIFFVEAKKPSVNIKDDVEPAYQIRRYSWTAKLPIGILTDFEELAIYDTRVKPNPKDKAGTARIKYLTFEELEENREWIYNTLSKEAVEKWALDKYIQEGKKKWTQSVDVDFLNMIDDRRDALAKNIYLRYEQAKQWNWDLDRLNNIVGDIVDKIIFLRIAEDKKIENSWNLETIANGKEIWKHLISYFEASDKKYNSGLFDNTEIFKKFELDDKILKQILLSLYYPACPYEFSVLWVDILGNIYEKFLGKTLVKEWRTIKTEFKPDVKKAWGVFYTPQYIVDYIVKNTVGELLKWKTPKQALELNIVDPACWSGAFLIWAYDYILNRFLEQHTLNEETIKKSIKEGKIYQFKSGYHLSFAYKKEILKNMIYGVDIDRQAVAVSKLSLLLKLLEWETAETANQLFSTIDAALLPKLDNNIKCGNSLIDNSIYANLQSPDEATIKKINAFDWEKEFAEVFAKWGFDVVIGNPPYVSSYWRQAAKFPVEVVKYYWTHYDTFSSINNRKNFSFNLIMLFLERGLKIIKKWCLLWFIIDQSIYQVDVYKHSRNYIFNNAKINSVVTDVDFPWVIVETTIIILNKWKTEKNYEINYYKKDINKRKKLNFEEIFDNWKMIFWWNLDIISKVSNQSINLSELTETFTWMQIIPEFFLSNDDNILENPKRHKAVFSKNIERYYIKRPTDKQQGKYITYDNELQDRIRKELQQKINKWEKCRTPASLSIWSAEKEYRFFSPKLIVSQTVSNAWWNIKLQCAIDESENYYGNVSIHIVKDNDLWKLKFIQWILNSKLITFYAIEKKLILWAEIGSKKTPQIRKSAFDELPIPKVSELQQQPIIELVDQMLGAQKKLRKVEFEDDKKVIEKQIEIIDGKIDNLVFDLYGLSEEERKIVLG